MSGTVETLSVAQAGQRGSFVLDAAFEAPLNGVTALFGPSGSGKTSVLRGMAGLERLRGRCALGRLVWQDAITYVPTHRRGVGYVFQEPSLFGHLSVSDNLRFGRRRYHGKEVLGFDQVVQLLGLWKLLERETANLSGGERQRVSLGRALLSQPRLLLLDEPMSALDAAAREELGSYLEGLQKRLGIPMVLVSHDLAEVERLATHLVVMSSGRVVVSGALSEVLLSDAVPLRRGRDAASILAGIVSDYDPNDALSTVNIGGQPLLVGGRAGAIGDAVRVRIGARDVSIAVTRPSVTTILNVLVARIVSVETLTGADANVTLNIGSQDILARVTRRSVAQLGLEPGRAVFAQIKGVSVIAGPAV